MSCAELKNTLPEDWTGTNILTNFKNCITEKMKEITTTSAIGLTDWAGKTKLVEKAKNEEEIKIIEDKKNNLKRYIELKNYEEKRYLAHKELIKIFTITFLIVFVLSTFKNSFGMFSGTPINVVIGILIAVSLIYIVIKIIDLSKRGDFNYDEIKYDLPTNPSTESFGVREGFAPLEALKDAAKAIADAIPNFLEKADEKKEAEAKQEGKAAAAAPSLTKEESYGYQYSGSATGADVGNPTLLGDLWLNEKGLTVTSCTTPCANDTAAGIDCSKTGAKAGYRIDGAWSQLTDGETKYMQSFFSGCKPCRGLAPNACRSTQYSALNDACKISCAGVTKSVCGKNSCEEPEPVEKIEQNGSKFVKVLRDNIVNLLGTHEEDSNNNLNTLIESGDFDCRTKGTITTITCRGKCDDAILKSRIVDFLTTVSGIKTDITTISFKELYIILQELYLRTGDRQPEFTRSWNGSKDNLWKTGSGYNCITDQEEGDRYLWKKLKREYVYGFIKALAQWTGGVGKAFIPPDSNFLSAEGYVDSGFDDPKSSLHEEAIVPTCYNYCNKTK